MNPPFSSDYLSDTPLNSSKSLGESAGNDKKKKKMEKIVNKNLV
jgi:hypothetical protein